ncbi:DUF3261 domain-containing protein [Rhodospirillum sp. A1_3_36]|uniref:DUF3261 domain-containing protein n=1 Tax=Rhodospirillum sp. A1_3_36 TaxID=3391666 RepID=UPI0039A575F6
MRLKILLLLAVLLTGACAAEPAGPDPFNLKDPFAVRLEDWGNFALPTPHWPHHAAPIEAMQRIEATSPNGTRIAFQARLSLGPQGAAILLLDDLGRRAITATWTDLGAHVSQASWLPSWVEGRRLLADLVMVYWPQTLVRSGLPSTLDVEEVRGDRRIILRKTDAPYLLIHHPEANIWNGRASLVNRSVGYRLDIQSTRLSPLSADLSVPAPTGAPSPISRYTTARAVPSRGFAPSPTGAERPQTPDWYF